MQFAFTLAAGAGAFGDASHPTTKMALATLEAIDAAAFAPRAACDMGAGSGILSLAIAAKFGCPVVAADIERTSVDTIRENAERDGLVKWVTAIHSDGFRHEQLTGPFDLIVMNILAEPLLALARDAGERLHSGGILILSGILKWQEAQIVQAYRGLGLELTSRLSLSDWAALTFQKP